MIGPAGFMQAPNTHDSRQDAQRPADGVVMPRILHLTLKKKWFDMIASGEKREEYREIKPYWNRRLMTKGYDLISFRNGYSKNAPTMLVEFKGLVSGLGIVEWGAPEAQAVYIIKLGKVLEA